jgi:hypothetical protein
MLIIDDALLLRFLCDEPLDWVPSGHERGDLATTHTFQYRLLIAALKDRPEGKHSSAIHLLPEGDRIRIRWRLRTLELHLTVLDPRPAVATAAAISVSVGRLSHLQCEALGAAVHHDAALAVTASSRSLEQASVATDITIFHVADAA